MISLELGELPSSRSSSRPDPRAVSDGLALLHGARRARPAEPAGCTLTEVGRALAALPVDPRLGRMLVEAHRTGCLREVLVIAAALSVQDPRERPTEQRQAADEKHARFAGEFTADGRTLDAGGSDFLAFVNLWHYVAEQRAALSGNRFRRLLREEFLHYLRIREWQDLHAQLRSAARNAGMSAERHRAPTPTASTSRCSPGCSARSGCARASRQAAPEAARKRGGREYLGARGAKFMIFPGSPLARKPPRWVMAAELVETSRLFARTVARIKPEWIEPLAGHLVKRTYSEPHWSRKRAGGRGHRAGHPARHPDRRRRGPSTSAASTPSWPASCSSGTRWSRATGTPGTGSSTPTGELLDDVEELEHRARRRDLVVDEETLVDFYDRPDPGRGGVRAALRQLVEDAPRGGSRTLLDFTEEMLRTAQAAGVDRAAYPDHVAAGGLTLPLSYAFEPGRAHRRRHRRRAGRRAAPGRPHAVHLAGARAARGAGHRADQDPAQAAAPALRARPRPRPRRAGPPAGRPATELRREPLLDGLERELGRMRGVHIPRDAWELDRLPEHLTVTFRVVDEHGPEVATGTDLEALRRQLAPQVRAELAAAGEDLERTGLTTWSIGTLPREHRIRRGSHVVTGYPGLVDRGSHCRRPGVPDRGRARPGHLARRAPAAAAGHARRPRSRCSAAWTTRPSWRCPATRTARWPRCSTTASPPRPTR